VPYIALIAIFALLLLELSGSIPRASVGGAMTIAFVVFIAAIAVGIREAWLKKLGIGGWIVSIVVAIVGAYVGGEVSNLIFGTIQVLLGAEGALAQTQHPLYYVWLVGMPIFTLMGSWLALRIVDRMR
jgi:hypothetical protein